MIDFMPLKFDKTTEDRRGKIIWLSSELTKINIVEIRGGFARGAHYHNHETTHFVISGKIEYREKNIDTGEEKTEIVLPHKEIKIPPRIAHLLIALEDSVFVETITDINDVTIVPEYRKIVNESMNIKN